MIRYPDALDDIEQLVAKKCPGWHADAAARTGVFQQQGRYVEEWDDPHEGKKKLAPIWGDVKPIFMCRQHRKCVYCERRLEGKEFARVEWDLEHFRPKGRIRAWPPKKSGLKYDFATGTASDIGYFLLAYHLQNYAASCKTCNSPFKSDYFPVASTRVFSQPSPAEYAAEEPFLIYPLGQTAEDPRDYIRFEGIRAVPRHTQEQDPARWRRARVIIDFFGLNRDGLLEERAWWLLFTIWAQVQLVDAGNQDAAKRLEMLVSERAPFASCAGSFVTLCEEDRAEAERLIQEFKEIVDIAETGPRADV